MDKENQANALPVKQLSVNKDEGKKARVELVPWQNQEICIVDKLNQCQALAIKLRSYVKIDLNYLKFHALKRISFHSGIATTTV